ncbi:unnamed protein product [Mytilus edulis]|uniref:CCHC-type domain-containing protein n=1 Tax=Mytilus edulis TaxID=6550 RepID=A0A8S3V3J4_MYTED|nr:unnamed protein product [Mytilus edulis]
MGTKDYCFKCGRYGHKSTECYNDKNVPYTNNTDDNGNSDKENPQPYDISQYAEVDDQNIDSSYTHSKFCSFDTGTRYFGQESDDIVENVKLHTQIKENEQMENKNIEAKKKKDKTKVGKKKAEEKTEDKDKTKSNKGAKTRIDKICISEALKHKIRDLKHIPYQYSDHKIVYISLKLQKTKWGNGYWKMNDSLLDKELYTEYINNFWINWKQRKSNYNVLVWWEIGKKKIKELTIRFSKQLVARERKELSETYMQLENEENKIQPDQVTIDNLSEIIIKLENKEKMGTIIRSRQDYYEEDIDNIDFFKQAEEKRGDKREVER